MANDHRSVPDLVLDLYLYPIACWGVALVLMFIWEVTVWAMQLLVPLALWQILLTAWWGLSTLRRYDRDDLSFDEAVAGVRSVGRILAASAMLPALVFVGRDPFALESLSSAVGVCVVSGVAWIAVHLLVRIPARWAYSAALFAAVLALPISTTGSVTVATMMGWYQVVVESTPLPDQLLLPPSSD